MEREWKKVLWWMMFCDQRPWSAGKFFTKKRTCMANHLIPSHLRESRVLYRLWFLPYFLANRVFAEKCGLDKLVYEQLQTKLRKSMTLMLSISISKRYEISLDDRSFDVVVMLAVFEHSNHRDFRV